MLLLSLFGLVSSALVLGGPLPQEPVALPFEQALAKHGFFSRLPCEHVEGPEPYDFWIQKTARNEQDRARTLVAGLVPLLDPVLERYEREIATPLGLEQRPDRSRFHVLLLASRGALMNYQGAEPAAWHLGATSFYDRGLDAMVLFEDAFQPARVAEERALSARHAMVHACQQAWYSGGRNAALDSWVLEGMADAWARQDPDAAHASIPREWLTLFVDDALDAGRRWASVRTLEELFFVHDPLRLDSLFRTRTPADAPPFDPAPSWWAFYHESSLFFQFLWEAGDGRHRPVLLAFLRQALAGHDDSASFAAGLGAGSAAELEHEFQGWLLAEHAGVRPAPVVDPLAFARAFERGPKGAPLFPGGGANAGPRSGNESALPEPATLALDVEDATPEEALALAIFELSVSAGRAAGARLDALLARTDEAALRARIERERVRATAWSALVDAFLEELCAGGGTLELTRDGRKLKSSVLGYSDGRLRLDKRRAPEELPVAELDPLELAQQMKPSKGGDDWVRLYPYVLRDDPRARKLLKEDGGPASALLADARDDYPERLRLGGLLARLRELGARPTAETPSGLRVDLDALAAWCDDAAGLALLERKRPAVRAHARSLLQHETQLLGAHTRLAGHFEARNDGTVKISYPCTDARELEDFDPAPYPVLARKALGTEDSEDEPFHPEQGAFTAVGQASLRHRVDLDAPLTLRYRLTYELPAHASDRFHLVAGLCDDGQENFLWLADLEHLQRHEPGNYGEAIGPGAAVYMGVPYAVELRHDGKNVTLFLEGKEQRALAAGGLRSGAFFLAVHGDYRVRVAGLEIEGRLRPDSFARLEEAWMARELERF